MSAWKLIVSDPYFGVEVDHPYSMIQGVQNVSGSNKHIDFVLDLKDYLDFKIDLQTLLHRHFIILADCKSKEHLMDIMDMDSDMLEKFDILKSLDHRWFNIMDHDYVRDFRDIKKYINIIFDEDGRVKKRMNCDETKQADCFDYDEEWECEDEENVEGIEYDAEYMVYDEDEEDEETYDYDNKHIRWDDDDKIIEPFCSYCRIHKEGYNHFRWLDDNNKVCIECYDLLE